MAVCSEAAVDAAVVLRRGRDRDAVLGVRPGVVHLPGRVGPLEHVRDPADLALRVGQLQLGELEQLRAEQPVGQGGHGVVEAERQADAGVAVRRGRRVGRAAAHVHADGHAVVVADLEEGVPVLGVDGRKTETGRDLAESDGPAALLGHSPRLGSSELGVPERDQAERDVDRDAVGIGRLAPLLDHPVVVRLHAGEAELLVVALVERLAAETGKRRERERAVRVIEGEVLDPLVPVPAALAHVVVGDGGHRHLGAVELEVALAVLGDRGLGDGDELLVDVDELVVVVPGVAPLALGVLDHVVLGAGKVLEAAPALALDPGTTVAPLLGEPRLPDVGWLDHVVVHADDPGQGHGPRVPGTDSGVRWQRLADFALAAIPTRESGRGAVGAGGVAEPSFENCRKTTSGGPVT